MNNLDAVSSLVNSLAFRRKELEKRITLIESKTKLNNDDKRKLADLEDKLEDIDNRLRDFEKAILNKLEQ